MSELVANCPRCGAKNVTFKLQAEILIRFEYNWQRWVEAFCVCTNCLRSTVFILSQREISHKAAFEEGLRNSKVSVNRFAEVEGYISLKDSATVAPPEHLPANIAAAFREGAACLAVQCYNAAGTMFRLCVDLSTRNLLPAADGDGLSDYVRRILGLRIAWLFDNGKLPEPLRELSTCIKDDGNDGAHKGTLTKEDAEDLLDFTKALLERIYTEPKKLELARKRRNARRKDP